MAFNIICITMKEQRIFLCVRDNTNEIVEIGMEFVWITVTVKCVLR